MTKKECFNCKNNKEGLEINWWDGENREHIEFCCWDCSLNLIQKESDEKTADWEILTDLLEQEFLIKKGVGGEIGLLFGAHNAKSCWIEMLPLMKTVKGINVHNVIIATNKSKLENKINILLEKMIILHNIFAPEVPKEVK